MEIEALNKLIKRAQKGDKDSYGQIYNLFLKQVFRYLYFSVRNFELAQDLTQVTFFKAWRALPNFSISRASFRTYLFTIARNLAIDEVRKKKEIPLEFISEYPSNEDPEENFYKEEIKQLVHQALDRLEKDEKELVILRFFEEFEYGEIAKTLGKKEGAIRVSLHRILKKLNQIIKEKNGR